MSPKEQFKVFKFKTVDLLPEDELLEKLKSKRPLRIKYGADPSRPDLHLGHYVCFRKLKDLQDIGHQIIFIIGDFTAMIGDPSGRDKTRPRLSMDEVKENAKTYMNQVFKILDPDKTMVTYNSQWLSKLDIYEVINLSTSYTVARMLERDDFSKRYKNNVPIFIHEFLYPLLQGYDSYAIQADLEVGGTDQKFNFIVAREVQKHYGQEPQVILTVPLLVGTDGKMKMSKSYDNYIAFNDQPEDIYGKVMSIPDELVIDYYSLVLYYDAPELNKIKQKMEEDPRNTKAKLAYEIVKIFYSETDAKKAEEHFNRVFREKRPPEELPFFKMPETGLKITELLYRAGLVNSKAEARRLVRQGAVRLNNEPIRDIENNITIETESILKVGKRRFLKLLPP